MKVTVQKMIVYQHLKNFMKEIKDITKNPKMKKKD